MAENTPFYPSETGSSSLQKDQKIKLILEKLSDGRAFTLIELAEVAKQDPSKTKITLDNWRDAALIQTRGNRKRTYYFIENEEVLQTLQKEFENPTPKKPKGMKYCRHCYNHFAGYAGVKMEEALVNNELLEPKEIQPDHYPEYKVTPKGWKWFSQIGIEKEDLEEKGGRLTKQCLDFSERKSHLGGKLGGALLSRFLENKWAKKVPDSREIQFTEEGRKQLKKTLNLNL